MSYLCGHKTQGSLAEWLGTGLQNRLQQFDSARNLNRDPLFSGSLFMLRLVFFYISRHTTLVFATEGCGL